MNQASLSAHSRAQLARLSVVFSGKTVRLGLWVCVVGCAVLGGILLYADDPRCWAPLGIGLGALLPLIWYRMWLKDLPPQPGQTVPDVLEGAVLGVLRGGESPRQIAEIAMRQHGGLFFASRFGIGPNFVRDLSSTNPADSEVVWQSALEIQRQLNLPTLSAATITAALVYGVPGRDQLLAQLQLTFNDVLAGVHWYHHLKDLIAEHASRKMGGGLGRDLNFGYTPQLSRFAVNISAQAASTTIARELEGHKELLEQLLEQLARGGRQNVVLIGPPGVGKTTLVHSFAERLLRDDRPVPPELRYRQVMALDPATIIANAKGRGELEGLLNELLVEAFHAKNVILFFDNAELFFSDETGAVDLRNILLPILENGGLRMILSMDEQQWLKLSRATPSLAQQLNRLSVYSLNEQDTRLVCEDQIILYEFRSKVTYMYQALQTAYRLGQRYVPDQAMPGQALYLLQSAANYAANGLVTAASVEQAVERAFGVRVATANQDEERAKLLNLEDLLHQRMINQTRAVSVVADALRRARSGVRNQNRPIGSFLFLGPTGVGKTELAKALGEVYFGGEDRLVRLDLNEFGQPDDVRRLLADGATDSRSLTAQIAKQPFSVVLLDEIEKAHPNVLNTLLQLLDEGILRDTNNREVSFRDAVVIATSNAGADRIRQYIQAGYQLEQFEQQFTNELIDAGQFKPEFLNRFDEIVLFRPLSEDELMQVVDLMLASVNRALAPQHVKVEVADDAKRRMVQIGYDPRLGARPLRRVVQRTVENIVAKRLLQNQVASGGVVQVTLDEVNKVLQS